MWKFLVQIFNIIFAIVLAHATILHIKENSYWWVAVSIFAFVVVVSDVIAYILSLASPANKSSSP